MTDATPKLAATAARRTRSFCLPRIFRNASLLIGATITATILLLAIFAPLVATHDLMQMDMPNRFSGPSSEHILGTDNFGRDLWSRLVHGARISLSIAVIAVLASAVIGTIVGLISGYFGGWVDLLLMRITDVFLGFPPLVLVLAVVAVMGPGLVNVAVSLIIVSWTEYARVVRSTTLSLREQNYVQAARALGASWPRILFREILPNSLGPIIVLASLGLGTAIIWESALSFLGFGLPPPAPTWGWSLSYGTRFIRDEPWMSIISGAAIMITVLGFNLLGDGLRDILDPRQQTRGKG
ncbi:ABC transporter permease [Rhodophyticola porphyridii]|uniref:ABC transporter permease n=1 Tax=Rhodophyticola porphyridii TaxID=1852017 RepID=A0A3L9XZ69_9RHOB|nr:ABC transporter permease [Rhodophyticola porphyridii]RMA41532.1 ABC transporter permease [Rhodophyticola porphyridii]